MDSRVSSKRAFATAAALMMASAITVVAPAGAEHAEHETCRSYAEVPNPFVKIEAEGDKFDTDCLRAPADRDWRIYFMNHDEDPHNISIYSSDPAVDRKAQQIYKGKAVKGRHQEEYAIEALPPGKYFFQDDKVKTMNGAIEIADKKK